MRLHRVVALALAPQSPFELACASEVFGTARDGLQNRYAFEACTDKPGQVATRGGFGLTVDAGLDRLEAADTIVITGYPEYERDASAEVIRALTRAHARGARVVSICSGAFLLAQAGLLAGRRATVHWRMQHDFARLHPDVDLDIDALYVDIGDVATSAGTAAGIDLCLHLVRRDFGVAYASRIARHMVMPPHREGGQLQYSDRARSPSSETLGPVLEWAIERLDSPLRVEDLAEYAHLSPRTLSRKFVEQLGMSPGRWMLAQRIDAARELLESTALTIETIASTVGLSSAVNLRRRFQKATGTGPAAYRRTFTARGI